MSTAQHSIESRHMNVCILGRLVKAPQVRYSAGGLPHLTVCVRQAGDCVPFVACKHGTLEDTKALVELASRLHSGTPVMVLGAGLEVEPDVEEFAPKREHVDAWRVRLVECKQITEVAIADPAEARRI